MFTGNFTAAVVEHYNQLLLQVTQVQSLVLVQLLHGLTERDGGRTPGVPGRSTAHPPRLTGLHTTKEVVVLLLLAGLLRPVEEVVLRDGDLIVIIGASHHVLSCIVLDQDPRKQSSDEKLVVFRVVDKNPVIKVGVQVEVVDTLCVVFV